MHQRSKFQNVMELNIILNGRTSSYYAYELHMRTMSTGEAHPDAERPVLPSFRRADLPTAGTDSWSAFRVQVSGNYVALLVKEPVESVGGHLEIWNYKHRSDQSVRLLKTPS